MVMIVIHVLIFICNVLIFICNLLLYAMFIFFLCIVLLKMVVGFNLYCSVKNIGSVMKPMRHPFWTDMPYMCHAYEMWRSGIVPFWIASEWATERGICDEPRVRTRFRRHNPIVLCCTIVRRAIGEQRGYATKILFRLIAFHKFMLCWPRLGGFRTYPFL